LLNRFIQLLTTWIHLFILPFVSLRVCTNRFDTSAGDVQAGCEGRVSYAPTARSESEMNTKKKIQINAIQDAQRALDALPHYQPEEITKAKAIGMLITQIRAAQSKGYGLDAIGRMLSERGIPITTSALRATLSDAKLGAGRKKKRKTKSGAQVLGQAPPDTNAVDTSGHKAAPAQAPPVPAKPRLASPARGVDLDWDPAAPSEKLVQEQAAARRQGFYVRPDTKDI
jgi:hypothetical protein